MQPKESLIRFLFFTLNVYQYSLNLNMLLVYWIGSINAVLAQQVEHFHGKEEVGSSNLLNGLLLEDDWRGMLV